MRSFLYSGSVILFFASIILFQNCSTNFGNGNAPTGGALSLVFHWGIVNGQCSVQCGTGTQTPLAVCQDQFNNSALESKCPSPKPTYPAQSCQVQACGGAYAWSTAIAGSCTANSGNCGAGTQPQTVICRNQAGQQVPDSFCSGTAKPPAVVACDTGASCLPRPAPNSMFGCNPGIFDHCIISTAAHASVTVAGTCETGFAATSASGCYGTCQATAKAAEQWTVFSSCGHAGTSTAY